jgi:hypothetical protein
LWASFSFFTIAWTYFVLPEMKGHSLEQLDFLFNNRVPTHKFKTYVFTDSVLAVQDKKHMDIEKVGDEKMPHETVVEQ